MCYLVTRRTDIPNLLSLDSTIDGAAVAKRKHGEAAIVRKILEQKL
jgi:hypothetical protein